MPMTADRPPDAIRECLVTGATGLLGNNVVRQLVAAGRAVRALVRPTTPDGGTPLADLRVRSIVGRLDDERAVQAAIDGATSVVHAAALVHVGWQRAAEMHHVNVEGTRRVAAAARRAGARLVYVSSVDAIGLRSDGLPADEDTPPGGMPPCPYVLTKQAAEAVVLDEVDKGLDAVIVSPVYMIGPWDWKPSSGRMLLEVAAGRGLFAPPGRNDFVDVRDVADGVLAAAVRGRTGRRYILGGHSLSYLEAWRIFARVTGRRPPIGLAPRPFVRVAGWCGDLAGRLLGRESDINSAATTIALLAHNFDCGRARRELGYECRPLEDAARDAWAWFQERGYAGRRLAGR
jgi:dihydroflavonol-4-reductase